MKQLRPLMVAGTGSDVGKSLIVAALCRVFRQDGYNPAPYKAQNMAPYYYTAPNGDRISIAQAIQAKAAGIEPSALLNPVLMMPSSVTDSKIFCLGKEIGTQHAREYFRQTEGRELLKKSAWQAYDQLSEAHNPIVIEGAGSITELNLIDTDFVNMPMAEYAGAAVFLVADIERGGVFASLYGSLMLQKPEHRKLIKGLIINKFRGDMTLFTPAISMIEELTQCPVVGVLPYLEGIDIPSEDSLSANQGSKVSYLDQDLEGFEETFDLMADHLRQHLDMNKIYEILSSDE